MSSGFRSKTETRDTVPFMVSPVPKVFGGLPRPILAAGRSSGQQPGQRQEFLSVDAAEVLCPLCNGADIVRTPNGRQAYVPVDPRPGFSRDRTAGGGR
jgi:hypothetical protein